jgi:hypothetical protein
VKKTELKRKTPLKSKSGFKRKTTPKSKIRESAEGRECQVRIPGVCNGNPSSSSLAHLNGGGMGQKVSDFQGAYCCDDCHAVHDGRVQSLGTPYVLKCFHLEAVIRTQQILFNEGLIKTPGSK